MLMTIDVGNTNIVMGVFHGEDLAASFRINSRTERTSDELGILIFSLLQSRGISVSDITDIIVSSVVPKIMHSLTSSFLKYFNIDPMIIGPGSKTGISIRTDNPKEVGADRIVNVAAAHELYKRSAIVIDFGTATTFDYVNSEGVFQYTVIMPGLEIVARALTSNTAKLPEVEIMKPDTILASNTIHGMQSGIVYGYIGAVDYTIRQMLKELGDEPYIVATGGLGRVIEPEIELIQEYDPDIAFKGMKIIYKKTRRITSDLVN
ncbi:MAG: type III pantothenate kinase [Clostridia bacterium]|nr:type III pantothenate kinase [Clostridia bacterium]